ncbi:MAG: hypothetical protein K2X03_28580 [Bryobacteraceae bacterium]|nr:hypothetical protein [Bryobacteraceae bacterium]
MAKLSHSSHTEKPKQDAMLSQWEETWPSIQDACIFWFFARAQDSFWLRPRWDYTAAGITRWATHRHLLDENGKVPGWVQRELIGFGKDERWIDRMWESRQNAGTFQIPLHGGTVGLAVRALKGIPAPISDVITELAPEFQERLNVAAATLFLAMTVRPNRESMAKARKRILAAFDPWLNIQLVWCLALDKERTSRLFDDAELSLFWRFQCEGVSMSKLANQRKGESAGDFNSGVRKTLERVSDRLRIPLRRDKPGRPRKITEST